MSKEYTEITDEPSKGLLDIMMIIDDAFKGLVRYWILLLVIVSLCSSMLFPETSRYLAPVMSACLWRRCLRVIIK